MDKATILRRLTKHEESKAMVEMGFKCVIADAGENVADDSKMIIVVISVFALS